MAAPRRKHSRYVPMRKTSRAVKPWSRAALARPEVLPKFFNVDNKFDNLYMLQVLSCVSSGHATMLAMPTMAFLRGCLRSRSLNVSVTVAEHVCNGRQQLFVEFTTTCISLVAVHTPWFNCSPLRNPTKGAGMTPPFAMSIPRIQQAHPLVDKMLNPQTPRNSQPIGRKMPDTSAKFLRFFFKERLIGTDWGLPSQFLITSNLNRTLVRQPSDSKLEPLGAAMQHYISLQKLTVFYLKRGHLPHFSNIVADLRIVANSVGANSVSAIQPFFENYIPRRLPPRGAILSKNSSTSTSVASNYSWRTCYNLTVQLYNATLYNIYVNWLQFHSVGWDVIRVARDRLKTFSPRLTIDKIYDAISDPILEKYNSIYFNSLRLTYAWLPCRPRSPIMLSRDIVTAGYKYLRRCLIWVDPTVTSYLPKNCFSSTLPPRPEETVAMRRFRAWLLFFYYFAVNAKPHIWHSLRISFRWSRRCLSSLLTVSSLIRILIITPINVAALRYYVTALLLVLVRGFLNIGRVPFERLRHGIYQPPIAIKFVVSRMGGYIRQRVVSIQQSFTYWSWMQSHLSRRSWGLMLLLPVNIAIFLVITLRSIFWFALAAIRRVGRSIDVHAATSQIYDLISANFKSLPTILQSTPYPLNLSRPTVLSSITTFGTPLHVKRIIHTTPHQQAWYCEIHKFVFFIPTYGRRPQKTSALISLEMLQRAKTALIVRSVSRPSAVSADIATYAGLIRARLRCPLRSAYGAVLLGFGAYKPYAYNIVGKPTKVRLPLNSSLQAQTIWFLNAKIESTPAPSVLLPLQANLLPPAPETFIKGPGVVLLSGVADALLNRYLVPASTVNLMPITRISRVAGQRTSWANASVVPRIYCSLPLASSLVGPGLTPMFYRPDQPCAYSPQTLQAAVLTGDMSVSGVTSTFWRKLHTQHRHWWYGLAPVMNRELYTAATVLFSMSSARGPAGTSRPAAARHPENALEFYLGSLRANTWVSWRLHRALFPQDWASTVDWGGTTVRNLSYNPRVNTDIAAPNFTLTDVWHTAKLRTDDKFVLTRYLCAARKEAVPSWLEGASTFARRNISLDEEAILSEFLFAPTADNATASSAIKQKRPIQPTRFVKFRYSAPRRLLDYRSQTTYDYVMSNTFCMLSYAVNFFMIRHWLRNANLPSIGI